MTIAVFIIGLALVVIAAMLECASADRTPISTIVAGAGATFITVVTVVSFHTNKPTALDVYQGKTTLHVTYEGKTPIDSVVVYKANKE